MATRILIHLQPPVASAALVATVATLATAAMVATAATAENSPSQLMAMRCLRVCHMGRALPQVNMPVVLVAQY